MKTMLLTDFVKIAGISSLAGIRTMGAPMILSHYITRYERAADNAVDEKDLQVDRYMKRMALAEMIVDKVPLIPNRIAAPGLVGRSISGALTGAAISKRTSAKTVLPGIITGALSAMAMAYLSFYIRRKISKRTRIPDALIGLVEDMVLLKAGAAWVRGCRKRL